MRSSYGQVAWMVVLAGIWSTRAGEVKRFMWCASHGLCGLDSGLRRNDHKAR